MDLTKITSDNFNESFKINEVLLNSVFYPASHLDGIGIELFSQEFNSYVHADYSTPREMVYNAMFNHFSGVGYDLVGIKDISKNELNPGGYTPSKITMTEYENERLNHDFIRDLYMNKTIKSFALWAVYELNEKKTGSTEGKAKMFSL